MNTKDKDYREWLKLQRMYNDFEWSYTTSKEESEVDKLLEHPKFLKFHWRKADGPTKDFIKDFHRGDRRHNKRALNKNITMLIENNEGDYVTYRYNHKNSAKWSWW